MQTPPPFDQNCPHKPAWMYQTYIYIHRASDSLELNIGPMDGLEEQLYCASVFGGRLALETGAGVAVPVVAFRFSGVACHYLKKEMAAGAARLRS